MDSEHRRVRILSDMEHTNHTTDRAVIELAEARHQQGYNCAQSVFSALAERVGLPVETALKIAAPFGGGIGRLGEVCGAVSGGLMAIGAAEGHTAADPAAKERSYRLARDFAEEFRRRHGAITCRELLGCDIGTPEGQQQAREAGLFKQRCPLYVRDAVEIAGQMLAVPPGTPHLS